MDRLKVFELQDMHVTYVSKPIGITGGIVQ